MKEIGETKENHGGQTVTCQSHAYAGGRTKAAAGISQGFVPSLLRIAYLICFLCPPTLKKWGAYWFRLVLGSVRRFKKKIKARVLKFHIWIPHPCSLYQHTCDTTRQIVKLPIFRPLSRLYDIEAKNPTRKKS